MEDSSKVPELEVVDEEVIDAPVEEAVLESCPDAELEVKVFLKNIPAPSPYPR